MDHTHSLILRLDILQTPLFTLFSNISSWMKIRISEVCCFLKEKQRSNLNLLTMDTSIQNRAKQFRWHKSICLNGLDHVYVMWSSRIFILIGRKVLWSNAFDIIKLIGNNLFSIWIVRKRWFFWRTKEKNHMKDLHFCIKHYEVPYSSQTFA